MELNCSGPLVVYLGIWSNKRLRARNYLTIYLSIYCRLRALGNLAIYFKLRVLSYLSIYLSIYGRLRVLSYLSIYLSIYGRLRVLSYLSIYLIYCRLRALNYLSILSIEDCGPWVIYTSIYLFLVDSGLWCWYFLAKLPIYLPIYCRLRALRLGLSGRATFFRTDLWKHNLNQYDNIVIFGVEQMVSNPVTWNWERRRYFFHFLKVELGERLKQRIRPDCPFSQVSTIFFL